jgi:hypothetical protein
MALPKSPSDILIDSREGIRNVNMASDDISTILLASFFDSLFCLLQLTVSGDWWFYEMVFDRPHWHSNSSSI